MREHLLEIIIHLKLMNIIAHYFHNTCSRVVFFQDHEIFGSFYEEYDKDFDDVSERFIGFFSSNDYNLKMIMSQINEHLDVALGNYKDNAGMFHSILVMEEYLNSLIKIVCSSSECTEGTKQLLGDISNKSEKRIYKIKQRMVK